jgi:hypothetical protein
LAVTDDIPQKNWAPTTITSNSLPPVSPMASMLLGHVGRGVVAGERVLGQQQTDQHDVERRAPARVVDELGEHDVGRPVAVRQDHQRAHDDDDADQVPPHADVVQLSHQAHAERVEQPVGHQDQPEQEDRVARGGIEAPLQVEQCVEEERRPDVDARGHGHLAEEVEPPGEPRPRRPVAGRELGRPVVQPPGGRAAGAQFEKPDVERSSSCAYPSSCSRVRSAATTVPVAAASAPSAVADPAASGTLLSSIVIPAPLSRPRSGRREALDHD